MISIAIVSSITILFLDTYRGRNFRYRPALVGTHSVTRLWATKSEGVGLSVRAISFQDFQPTVCDPDPSTSQTDGQTDGPHAISIPRYALVHHAGKKLWELLSS